MNLQWLCCSGDFPNILYFLLTAPTCMQENLGKKYPSFAGLLFCSIRFHFNPLIESHVFASFEPVRWKWQNFVFSNPVCP